MMKYLLAGLTSIGVALCWNRLWRQIGFDESLRMCIFIPLSEELSKFFVASLFHLSPFWMSALFGLGEGCYEMFRFSHRSKLMLLLAAFLMHSLFGLGYLINGKIWPGLAIGLILHSGWNTAVYLKNSTKL